LFDNWHIVSVCGIATQQQKCRLLITLFSHLCQIATNLTPIIFKIKYVNSSQKIVTQHHLALQ